MRSLISMTKAVADPNRVRVLCALAEEGELCVCQIQELLALAPSTTSKHLSLLAGAGLIDSRKEGRWVHYRLAGGGAPRPVRELISWVRRHAADEEAVSADRKVLAQILKFSPEELCQRQAKGQRCCSSARVTRAVARWPKGGRAGSGAT